MTFKQIGAKASSARSGRAGTIALAAALAVAAAGAGCATDGTSRAATADDSVDLLPREPASQHFWDRWSDGRAELSAYRLQTPRYGEIREGIAVLIYVLESADSRTWIKDDRGEVPEEHQTVVMKLNHLTRFQTGIYPYAVMRSVFSPVGGIGRERFAPTRITFTSQEWCGQVFHRVMPAAASFTSEIRSYFSVEGEEVETVDTEPLALYEDALLVQLRELDGPFADGGDWSGQIVPALWQQRRAHTPLRPVDATITRSEAQLDDGTPVTRFVLAFAERTRTFDVELAEPRRILRWTTSDGEVAELAGTERLTYWQLNGLGDESYRERLGLDPAAPLLLEQTADPEAGEPSE